MSHPVVRTCSLGRVVKAIDLRPIGRSPGEFQPRRMQFFFVPNRAQSVDCRFRSTWSLLGFLLSAISFAGCALRISLCSHGFASSAVRLALCYFGVSASTRRLPLLGVRCTTSVLQLLFCGKRLAVSVLRFRLGDFRFSASVWKLLLSSVRLSPCVLPLPLCDFSLGTYACQITVHNVRGLVLPWGFLVLDSA